MLTKLCHCPPLVDTGVAFPSACIKGRPDGALPLNFHLMIGNLPLLTWEVPFGKSIYCRINYEFLDKIHPENHTSY